MIKLNAQQLRQGKGDKAKDQVKKHELYIILDNVLDTYNIGAIFRLADAVAAKKIFLCGGTETPPNHKIKKSSINTTEVVDWQYFESAEEAILTLRKEIPHLKVVAIEQSPAAIPYDKYEYPFPIALVVGHETEGVSNEVLDLCDVTVELPMFGINISLNVMVSLGIVLYEAIKGK